MLQLLTVRPIVSNCCSSSASACISPAATVHFLEELHSTDAFAGMQRWCSRATDTQQHHIDSDSSRTRATAVHLRDSPSACDTQLHHNDIDSLRQELTNDAQLHDIPGAFLTSPADNMPSRVSDSVGVDAVNSHLARAESAQQPAEHATNSATVSAAHDLPAHADAADQQQFADAVGGSQLASVESADWQQSLAGPTERCSKAAASASAWSCSCQQKAPTAVAPDNSEPQSSAKSCCRINSFEGNAIGGLDRQSYTAEAICMFFFLIPKTVWNSIQDTQVRESVLKLLEVPVGSIVASEVKYLANQWAELPELQQLEDRRT